LINAIFNIAAEKIDATLICLYCH